MKVANLPLILEYVPDWGSIFVERPDLYTIRLRRKLINQVIEDMEMTAVEAREFERRALFRAAFARPEVFVLRLLQTLSEVCR